MTLRNVNEIKQGETLIPVSEAERVRLINGNRELYNGNLRSLGVDDYNDDGLPSIKVNWFRRMATFYPEFMLAERPIINIRGNARFQEFIEEGSRDLWSQILYANIDMLRYGSGIITTHPDDPLTLLAFTPDTHFMVESRQGVPTADLFYTIRGDAASDDAQLDLYIYYVDGKSQLKTHKFQAGIVGPLLRSEDLPKRSGRQLAEFVSNREHASVFDDIKPMIGELSRTLTSMSSSIRRNLRPHLYGPDGVVVIDESGNAEIDIKGMYFPLHEGDTPPDYIQWDTKLDAVSYNVETNIDMALNMAGLNRLLFDPTVNTGDLSGVALRRLLLPFTAKLNQYKEVNDRAILQILDMVNQNNAAMGGELFQYNNRDVSIEWKYEEVFMDEMINQDGVEVAERPNTSGTE